MCGELVRKLFCCAAAALFLSASAVMAGAADRLALPEEEGPGVAEGALVIETPSEEVVGGAAEFEELYAAGNAESRALLRRAFAKNVKERVELYVKLHCWKEDSWGKSELEKLLSSFDYKTKLSAYRAKSEDVCPAAACLDALKEFGGSIGDNELRFYGNEVMAYALRSDLYEDIR